MRSANFGKRLDYAGSAESIEQEPGVTSDAVGTENLQPISIWDAASIIGAKNLLLVPPGDEARSFGERVFELSPNWNFEHVGAVAMGVLGCPVTSNQFSFSTSAENTQGNTPRNLLLFEGDNPNWPYSSLTEIDHTCQTLLSAFKHELSHQTFDRLMKRLTVLFDKEEWDKGKELPNIESFLKLITFLASYRNFSCPSIFLTQRGFFEASWRKDVDKLVTLEFQPSALVRWLVFAPARTYSQLKEAAAGETDFDSVMSRISIFGAENWMTDA